MTSPTLFGTIGLGPHAKPSLSAGLVRSILLFQSRSNLLQPPPPSLTFFALLTLCASILVFFRCTLPFTASPAPFVAHHLPTREVDTFCTYPPPFAPPLSPTFPPPHIPTYTSDGVYPGGTFFPLFLPFWALPPDDVASLAAGDGAVTVTSPCGDACS